MSELINEIFHKIIYQLQNNQPIAHNQLADLGSSPRENILLSLLILFYNIRHQSISQSQIQRSRIMQILNDKFMLVNKILPLISQLIDFPQPSLYLAQFNFDEYSNFCEANGLESLLRHSKGILPYINKSVNQIPVYYPYHDMLNFQPFGNRNWKIARRILGQTYRNIKLKQIDPKVDLCYHILLGIPQLKDMIANTNKWSVIWVETYLQFLEEGLRRAEQQQSNSQNVLSMGEQNNRNAYFNINYFDPDSFDSIILLGIKMIVQNDGSLLQIIFRNISSKLPNNDYLCLIFSIILKSSQLLKQSNLQKLSKEAIITLLEQQSENKQAMLKIFMDQQEIMEYYKKRDIFPKYHFNDHLMKEISRSYLKNHPQRILSVIDFMKKEQLYLILMNNPYLEQPQIGSKIIQHLKKNKTDYIRIIQIKLRSTEISRDFDEFIKSWFNYYEGIRQLQVNEMNDQRILRLFELIKNPIHKYSQKFNRIITDPRKNQNTIYQIVIKYSRLLTDQVRMDDYSYIPTQCYQAYKKQHFSNLLKRLDTQQVDQVWSILYNVVARDQSLIYDLLMNHH